jgi:hypothetical protein
MISSYLNDRVSVTTKSTRHGLGDGAIRNQHPRTILLRIIDFNYYREGYNTPIIPYTESIMKITKPFCNQVYLFSSHVNSASSFCFSADRRKKERRC